MRPRQRSPRHTLHACAVWLTLAVALATAGHAQVPLPEGGSGSRALVIELIDFNGNGRTSDTLARAHAGLRAGEPVSPTGLLEARDRLRVSGLFRSVDVHTRPGSAPGRVVVVFEVEESRPHVRLGVGYEDLTGWYLIPAQLNLDNLTGNGEEARVSWRIGYRTNELVASLRQTRVGDRRTFFGLVATAGTEDRIYFHRGVEVRHTVSKGSLRLGGGIRVHGPLALEGHVGAVVHDPDDGAVVHLDRGAEGISAGDSIPTSELPASVADDLEELGTGEIGAALVIDSREGRNLAQRGWWGRVGVTGAIGDSLAYTRAGWDLRAYFGLGTGQLALRTRGGTVTEEAPFYERHAIGGLYTIRGHASQSLSPPGGDLNFTSAHVELRVPLIGRPELPRLAAIAFLDAGRSWSTEDPSDGFASLGYGVRVRVPWIGLLGIDVGLPGDDSALGDAFRVHGSLGWTF